MAEQLRTFLRLKQVKEITGMSRSWIYEAMRRGEFPNSVALSKRARGWDSDAIAEWQKSRIQHTNDKTA
ncbi:MAG: AlpA family phage regulatory protein [Gammaproteobacteria bacterium]